MKKSIILVVIIAAAGALPAFSQQAESFQFKINGYDGQKWVTINGWTGKEKNVIIPSFIDGVPVKEIGDQAFMYCGINSVFLPEGIVSIGRQAFYGNNLGEVVLPASVTNIGVGAFDNNKLLKSIVTRSNRLPVERPVVERPPSERQAAQRLGADRQAVQRQDEEVIVDVSVTEKPAVGNPAAGKNGAGRQRPDRSGSGNPQVGNSAAGNSQVGNPAAGKAPAGNAKRDTPQYKVSTPNADKLDVIVLNNSRPPVMISDQTLRPVDFPGLGEEIVAGPPERKESIPEKQNIITGSNLSGMANTPAAQTTEGTYFFQIEYGNTAKITAFLSAFLNVVIPEKVGNLLVTTIGPSAFYNKRLQSVTFPQSVVKIENAAFSGNQLSMVVLPNSVRYIGNQAFTVNPIQAITLGSGILMQGDSFPRYFADFYEKGGKKGGTYIWSTSSGQWVLAKSDDNVYIVE